MDTISHILALAKPSRPDRYRRYLLGLTEDERKAKLTGLLEDQTKQQSEPVKFWRVKAPTQP